MPHSLTRFAVVAASLAGLAIHAAESACAQEPASDLEALSIPALSFESAGPLSSADGWDFLEFLGGPPVLAQSSPSEGNGLSVTDAAVTPPTIIWEAQVGIWENRSNLFFNLEPGSILAARATFGVDVPHAEADLVQIRLRLETKTLNNSAGIGYLFSILENNPASPFHPKTQAEGGSTYVAYWRTFDLSGGESMVPTWDHFSHGSEAGMARTTTLMNLEVAQTDANAFESGAIPMPGAFEAGEFGDWSYVSLDGMGDFGNGLPVMWQGGSSVEEDGHIAHVDVNGFAAAGGVALWSIGEYRSDDANRIEFFPGVVYWNQFEVSTEDAEDTDYPGVQLEARTFDPALQVSQFLWTVGRHYDLAMASGQPARHDLFWTAPDNGPQAGERGDDLIVGFNMNNSERFRPTHGGKTTLRAARFFAIGPNDPNLP
jgi:hypothetical protein